MPTLERHGNEKPPKDESYSKNPTLDVWKRRLRLAELKLKKKGGNVKSGGEWKDLIRFFEGDQWKDGEGGKKNTFHRVTANLIKSNIDAIRPQLYFQNPRVKLRLDNPKIAEQDIPKTEAAPNPAGGPPVQQPVVDPQTGQPVIDIPAGTPIAMVGGRPVNAAKQVALFEAIDNRLLAWMQVKQKIRRNINDALVLPYAVSRIEWVLDTEMVADPDNQGKQIEKVVRQYPRFSRIKPWCFLWDTNLEEFDLSLAAWVAEVKYLSRQEIEEDEFLDVKESDWKNISDSRQYVIEDSETVMDEVQSSGSVPEDLKRYKTYEIHDAKNQRLLVYIDGMDGFARDEENPYKRVEGTIYSVLGFDETIDDSFPIPVSKQIKSKQEAYNFLRSYQVNHAARSHRRYQVQEGTVADEEIEKWQSGGDNTLIKIKTLPGIQVVDHATVQQDSYAVADLIKKEVTEDVGVPAYGRSSREPGVETAYEANLIQSGTDIKTDEKRDIVREYVKTIIRKMNTILQLYADKPVVEEVIGLAGTDWIEWTAADIQGDFIEDVDIYQATPYSKLEDRKQAMEMYSLIQQDQYYDPLKVRRELNRKMDWGEELLKTPEQMSQEAEQQKQAQMEMMQFEAGLKAQSKAPPAQQGQPNLQAVQAKTLRPSEGEIRRAPDMRAGILGPARNRQ